MKNVLSFLSFLLIVLVLMVGVGLTVYAQEAASIANAQTEDSVANAQTEAAVIGSNYPVEQVGTISHPVVNAPPVAVYATVPRANVAERTGFYSELFVHVTPTQAMGGKFYDPLAKRFACRVELRSENHLLESPAIQETLSYLVKGVPRNNLSPIWPINPMSPVGYLVALHLPGQREPLVLQRRDYSPGTSVGRDFTVLAENLEMADMQFATLEVSVVYEHKGMHASSVRITQETSLLSDVAHNVLGVPTGEDLSRRVFFVTRDMGTKISNEFKKRVRIIYQDEPAADTVVPNLELFSQVNSFFPERTLRDLKEESELFVIYTEEMGRVDFSAHTFDQIASDIERHTIASSKTREVSDALHEIAERTNDWKKFFEEVKSKSTKSTGGGGSFGFAGISFGANYQSAFTKDDTNFTAEEESAVRDFYEKATNKTLSESDFNTEEYVRILGKIHESKNTAKEIVLHQVDLTSMGQSLETSIDKLVSQGLQLKTNVFSVSLGDIEQSVHDGSFVGEIKAVMGSTKMPANWVEIKPENKFPSTHHFPQHLWDQPMPDMTNKVWLATPNLSEVGKLVKPEPQTYTVDVKQHTIPAFNATVSGITTTNKTVSAERPTSENFQRLLYESVKTKIANDAQYREFTLRTFCGWRERGDVFNFLNYSDRRSRRPTLYQPGSDRWVWLNFDDAVKKAEDVIAVMRAHMLVNEPWWFHAYFAPNTSVVDSINTSGAVARVPTLTVPAQSPAITIDPGDPKNLPQAVLVRYFIRVH